MFNIVRFLFVLLAISAATHGARAVRLGSGTIDSGTCGPNKPLPTTSRYTQPFTRTLSYQAGNMMSGNDVKVAQWLLRRAANMPTLGIDGVFGPDSANASRTVWLQHGRQGMDQVDQVLGTYLLQCYSADDYVDNQEPARMYGLLYKVYIPVYRNRSIETQATLFDANNTVLHTFTVRTHGQNNEQGQQLNQFAGSGDTPTGLSYFDLNSPEDDPKDYGPYPVNRATNGIKGNMQLLISHVRDGILMHTGEWSGWKPPMNMPNSHGCIHGYPHDIEKVWKILLTLGVQVRPNTGGALPYPYKPQGLLSIQEIEGLAGGNIDSSSRNDDAVVMPIQGK